MNPNLRFQPLIRGTTHKTGKGRVIFNRRPPKRGESRNFSTALALARNWNRILHDNVFRSLAGPLDSLSDEGAD